jgi:hypothetical protein
MKLSTRYGLAGIGALALLTIVHRFRGRAMPPQPVRDYLLGVLPNFAAAIAITFVLLSIWRDQIPEASSATRPFLICASFSGLGLLAWEFFQRAGNRLVFDPHDIGATLVGLGVASLVYRLATPAPCRGS